MSCTFLGVTPPARSFAGSSHSISCSSYEIISLEYLKKARTHVREERHGELLEIVLNLLSVVRNTLVKLWANSRHVRILLLDPEDLAEVVIQVSKGLVERSVFVNYVGFKLGFEFGDCSEVRRRLGVEKKARRTDVLFLDVVMGVNVPGDAVAVECKVLMLLGRNGVCEVVCVLDAV